LSSIAESAGILTRLAGNTSAQAVEDQITELRAVCSERVCKVLTLLCTGAWQRRIAELDLSSRHGNIPNRILHGFALSPESIQIDTNYHLPNSASLEDYTNVFHALMQKEHEKGQYLGPYSTKVINTVLGLFQTSLQSIIPKPGKPGKYCNIHNLSYPRVPLGSIRSITSHLQASDHLHTWGTFWAVVCIMATLPPGSEAVCEDVQEAYQSIPIRTEDWLALVVCIGEDQFCPDTCLCFGVWPGDRIHGEVADAFLDISRMTGLGPVLPWVDDNIWFRILKCYLPEYNAQRA
jgi:hypothetical protein